MNTEIPDSDRREAAVHLLSLHQVGHSGVELFLPAAEDEDNGVLLDEALAAARPMPVALLPSSSVQ